MNEQANQTATDQQDKGKASEKLFTQEEVNRIVSERLSRERAKSAQEQPPEDEREKALREREQALQARENKLACMDYLKEKGVSERYYAEFEALDTSDPEKFRKIVDTLGKHFVPETRQEGMNVPTPPHTTRSDDSIASIFAPRNR